MKKLDELAAPNSCLNKAGDEEELFVLLGRDRATPNTIRYWVNERLTLGLNKPDDLQITEALKTADQVEALQQEQR